jgi:hypothetical protein
MESAVFKASVDYYISIMFLPKFRLGSVPQQAIPSGVRRLSTTVPARQGVTLLQDKENGFGFARSNPRPDKPRSKGVTEIRGPYYTVCIDHHHSPHNPETDNSQGHGEALSRRYSRNVMFFMMSRYNSI